MNAAVVPEGWVVWTESEQKIVLAYRPDIFDSESFPAPCLPTLYLTQGKQRRQPGDQTRPEDPWYVTLFLEPEIHRDRERFETREAAVEGMVALAEQFVGGDIAYRDLYQVPRKAYLDELDDLTG